jgi:hypothetical protein
MLGGLLCLAVPAVAAAADTSTKNPASTSPAHPLSVKHSKHKSSKHSSSGKHARSKTQGKRKRGQAAIDSARAQQIQEALIRQHYLNGEPSGTWDAATQDAMRRYQSDQGWQSKMVPDSRALIKLGLGPSKDGLLNPESAMTDGPASGSGPTVVTKQTAEPTLNSASSHSSENKPQR